MHLHFILFDMQKQSNMVQYQQKSKHTNPSQQILGSI